MKYIYQQAGRRFFVWLRHSVGYLWMVFLAGYLAVNVGQSIFKTYQVKQETASLKQELEDLKLEKLRLESLLVYYQSDIYKEKELRRSLLLKKPNEKVFALPEYSYSTPLLDDYNMRNIPDETKVEGKVEEKEDEENWKKWFEYFFK